MSRSFSFIKKLRREHASTQRRSLSGLRDNASQRASLNYYAKPKDEVLADKDQKHHKVAFFTRKPGLKVRKKQATLLIAICVIVLLGMTTIISPVDMNIVVDGTRVRDDSVYRDYINSTFSGWTRKNKVTVNTVAIEKELLEEFPEVYDAHLYTPMFSRKLSVVLKIRPIAVAVQNGGTYVLVDTSGVIVSKTESLITDSQLMTISDDHLLSNNIGDRVYSTDIISFFYTLQQIVTQKNKKLEDLRYTDIAHMVSVRFADNNTYSVLFDISLGAVEQYSAYEAVQAELVKQGITPKSYIDVRLAEKVYYL